MRIFALICILSLSPALQAESASSNDIVVLIGSSSRSCDLSARAPQSVVKCELAAVYEPAAGKVTLFKFDQRGKKDKDFDAFLKDYSLGDLLEVYDIYKIFELEQKPTSVSALFTSENKIKLIVQSAKGSQSKLVDF